MAQENIEKPKKKKNIFPIILLAMILGGGYYGYTKYKYSQLHEETDDAQVASNISPVIPRVGGYINTINVKDNQIVKKGDVLITLDDRDLALKVQQAEAALAIARSNLGAAQAITTASKSGITSAESGIATINAQIESAKINIWKTTQDFNRYANLIKDHSVTQQQFEQAQAAKQTAEKQLQILDEQKNQVAQQTHSVASQSNATSSQIGVTNAIIKQREVELAEAKLNLSYATITAQADGMISKVNIQAGQLVQQGQSLFSIVLNNDMWVIANFKETQLQKIKIGQKVIINIDAYPNHNFEGTVASFSPATGSQFALLPPDNASGNFVKVVQRLPVKIEFNNSDALVKDLKPGMNATANINIK